MGDLVGRLLLTPDPKDRARLKAAAHAAVSLPAFTVKGIRVEVVDGPRAVEFQKNGVTYSPVQVQLRLKRNGKDVTREFDHVVTEAESERTGVPTGTRIPINPVRVHNPPILVPDPAGEVDLGERGKYREDAPAALIEIITDLVRVRLP